MMLPRSTDGIGLERGNSKALRHHEESRVLTFGDRLSAAEAFAARYFRYFLKMCLGLGLAIDRLIIDDAMLLVLIEKTPVWEWIGS